MNKHAELINRLHNVLGVKAEYVDLVHEAADTLQTSESSALPGKLQITAAMLNNAPDYERMFTAACTDLGLVAEALGLDPDAGGAMPILSVIADLKSLQPVSAAVPEGFKLVPIEPTQGMLEAARDWSLKQYGKPVGNDGANGCYQSMLADAPQLPQPASAAVPFAYFHYSPASSPVYQQVVASAAARPNIVAAYRQPPAPASAKPLPSDTQCLRDVVRVSGFTERAIEDEEPDAPTHGECTAEIMRLNVLVGELQATIATLRAVIEAGEQEPVTWDEPRIRAVSVTAAERVAKNAGVAPQLCFPHIYLTLKDALSAPPAPQAPAPLIGCVQHDCAECRARLAAGQARELSDAEIGPMVRAALFKHMNNASAASKNACIAVVYEVAHAVLAARDKS